MPAKAGIQKCGIPKHLPELIEKLPFFRLQEKTCFREEERINSHSVAENLPLTTVGTLQWTPSRVGILKWPSGRNVELYESPGKAGGLPRINY